MIAAWSRKFSDDAPRLQAVRMNYANALKALGRTAEALECEKKVIEMRRRFLDERHPDLLLVLGNHGGTLARLGRYAEAIEIIRPVLAAYEETLPAEHPYIQGCRMTLGQALTERGDYEAALSEYRKVYDAYSRTMPREHPNLQRARVNLAVAYAKKGRPDLALPLLETALEVFGTTLPDGHVYVMDTRRNYAGVLSMLGRREEARLIDEEILDRASRTLPEDHPTRLGARWNIANGLMDEHRYEEALQVFEGLIASYSKTHPGGSSQLMTLRELRASLLEEVGRPKEALEILDALVEEYSKRLSRDHRTVRGVLLMKCFALRGMGRIDETYEIERELFDSFRRTKTSNRRSRGLETRFAESLVQTGRRKEAGRLLTKLLDRSIEELRKRECFASPKQLAEGTSFDRETLNVALGGGYEEGPDAARLFTAVELSRASWLSFHQLRASADGLPAAARKRLDELRAELLDASRELTWLARGAMRNGSPADAADVRRRFEAAVGRQRSAEAASLEIVKSVAPAGLPLPTVEGVAASLGSEQAAVGFWRYIRSMGRTDGRGVDYYLAFVVRSDGRVVRVELGAAEDIDRAVELWRSAVRDGSGTSKTSLLAKLGERVRERILDPVLAAAGDADHLVVALADTMHLVPLDALPGKTGGLIGDTVRISVVSRLRELLQPRTGSLDVEPRLLAAGAIAYDEEPGEGTAISLRDVDSPPTPSGALRLAALPQSALEVAAVGAAFRARFPAGKDVATLKMSCCAIAAICRTVGSCSPCSPSTSTPEK